MYGKRPLSGELTVLVLDEHVDQLDHAARLVEAAGHRVAAKVTDPDRVAEAVAALPVDALIVALHDDPEHVLQLIEAAGPPNCPVVLLLDHDDPTLVRAALEQGADAYADRDTLGAVESAIELARRRSDERSALERQIHELEKGAGRRALIERAKGVVMERHGVEEHVAYEMLRHRARSSRATLAHVAQSVLDARALF